MSAMGLNFGGFGKVKKAKEDHGADFLKEARRIRDGDEVPDATKVVYEEDARKEIEVTHLCSTLVALL
jgi:hypothetical protein